ncbi:MAG: hypothetical protein ABI190_09190, partial [Casimicrobiaceae bacterium]
MLVARAFAKATGARDSLARFVHARDAFCHARSTLVHTRDAFVHTRITLVHARDVPATGKPADRRTRVAGT